jgi:DNA-binding NarL/FixJ family response regulator
VPNEPFDRDFTRRDPIRRDPTGPPIRLVLLNEHMLFRESLARLLASEPGFELVAGCASGAEALEVLERSGADVVLLDLRVGQERSDQFMGAARRAGYAGKYLIVTSTLDAGNSAMALRLGASGVFLQSGSSARLVQAIRMVVSGESWVDPQIIQLLADRYPMSREHSLDAAGLNSRQQAVLDGVAGGLTNRIIADKLGVSEGTVKATLQQLFVKAGVRTRSQLVRAALEGSFVFAAQEVTPLGSPVPGN